MCYIHPAVISAHADDALSPVLGRISADKSPDLGRAEAAVLRLLKARS